MEILYNICGEVFLKRLDGKTHHSQGPQEKRVMHVQLDLGLQQPVFFLEESKCSFYSKSSER